MEVGVYLATWLAAGMTKSGPETPQHSYSRAASSTTWPSSRATSATSRSSKPIPTTAPRASRARTHVATLATLRVRFCTPGRSLVGPKALIHAA
jgi:hypothetical protein